MNRNLLNFLLELKYGNLTKDLQEDLKEESVFSKYVSFFTDEPYPLPESSVKEIDTLIKLMESKKNSEEWKDVEEFVTMADEQPMEVINQFCQSIEVEFKEDYFKKLQSKLRPFILKLKVHYNRPRPYQFGYYTKQPINPMYSFTAGTPAYPSGHTIQAYFQCEVIAFHNPEKRDEIMQLAKMIADSREVMGVHYESDNLFSRYIVDELIKIKEIKDIYFNPKKLKAKEKQEN